MRWKVIEVLSLALGKKLSLTSSSDRPSVNHDERVTRELLVQIPTDGTKCNCTKPEVLLQSMSSLRINLQSPEVDS
ncbi:hypothetical protein SLE2022_163500 [Rubroshorea leprosula]